MKRTTFLKTLGIIGASIGSAHELFGKTEAEIISDRINESIKKSNINAKLKNLREETSRYKFDPNSPENSLQQKIIYQKKYGIPITAEILDNLSKTYSSGRKMEIGDYLLWGEMFHPSENYYSLITFHEEEIGPLYYDSETYTVTEIMEGYVKKSAKRCIPRLNFSK